MATFESKSIWLRSMGDAAGKESDAQLERLRAAYRSFWKNATVLSQEIQRDVSNLTLHDEAHFDALWSRVDQIAGPNLILTPLEIFVLGGAILLHDNANSLAAFEGGLAELRKTSEWQDAAMEWFERNGGSVDLESLPSEASSSILFEVLRSLHAERASTLAGLSFTSGGQTFHLVDDDQLRAHVGDVMGQIAASHHWDIASLPSRLPPICGALAGMPPSWTVRPVLLACLLRCADAAQLDQQRAPDFLYAMLRLHGLSELHWRAQNRLATPVVSMHDPAALIFSSTIPFAPQDSDAWWIAHDAIQVANRELQASNALLRDLRLPPLGVSRVEGALSPSALSRYVLVRGWRPVQAEVKISQIGKVVEMFGGEQLYGRDPSVALRELIQNSSDAIRFRRELEPYGSGYEGRITVRFRACNDGTDSYWLDVEDDGLGMSEAVLTGPLIDFGSSYMSSALVKSERPGLLSKGKKRIGQFGIGFFSSFMIADEVLVTSRPFDAGRDELRTLHFRDGLGHRPLLLESQPVDLSAMTSTRVRLRVTAKQHAELLRFPSGGMAEPISISLSGLVGALCPMLDVDVFVEDKGENRLIHQRRWMEEDRLSWLRRVTAADARADQRLDEHLAAAVPLLAFIDENDPSAGLACITRGGAAGVSTVGSLRANVRLNSFRDEFTGVIDYEPDGPRRAHGRPRARERLSSWATDQARKHCVAGTEVPRRVYIAQRVADFGGDATPILMMRLNHEWADLDTLLVHLKEVGSLYAPVKYGNFQREEIVITIVRERHSGFLDNYRPGELDYVVPTLQATTEDGSKLYALDKECMGFFWLLSKYAAKRGYAIKGEIIERVEFARYVGQESLRDGLVSGKMIGCSGLRIWAEPIEVS